MADENAVPIPQGATTTPVQEAAMPIPEGATTSPVQSDGGFAARRAAGVGVNPALKTGSTEGPTGVAGVASGFANEAGKTGEGLGKIAGMVTGVDPVAAIGKIPGASSPEQMDLQNTTFSQKAGGVAETIGEFATGEEILKGVSRLAKLEKLAQNSPTIAKILEHTPDLIHKIVSSGAKAGIVGGAQGGVKGAAEGDAKAGAEGGAIGGAVGGAAGEVAGAVAKPVLNKLGIATTAEEDAMKAFQPKKGDVRFLQNWDKAKDRIVQETADGGDFKDWKDASTRLGAVRSNIWSDIKSKVDAHAAEDMFSTPPRPGSSGAAAPANASGVASNPIASAVRKVSTDAESQLASPAYLKGIESYAKRMDVPMTISKAETILERANAELDDMGYWEKTPEGRRNMAIANPGVGARVAAADALRNSIYDHLENAGEGDVRDLKKQYGAVSELQNYARGRINVDGRARPISLKQIVGAAAGLAHGGVGGVVMGAALPLLDKMYNDPIALLNRAAAKEAPGAIRSGVNKVAGAAAENAGAAGGNAGAQAGQWVKVKDSNGQQWEVHPEDYERMQAADPGVQQVQ